MQKRINVDRVLYWLILSGLAALLISSATGCGTFPITDSQIEGTGTAVETGVKGAGALLSPALGVPSDVGGGIFGVLGVGIAIGVKALLKALQKKKDDHIREVANSK